jgi:site-specific DNA recombinase
MEGTKQIGIWIRVSTEDQARGDSPEHHEKRARLYAESKGWQVREVYHLEAVSGKAVMQHPEAKRMLEDLKQGNISGLIFSKLARLARNTKELLEFSEIFNANNADLISLQESIDTSTPAGRLFYTMIAAMAQWEREEIADRVSASIAIRAKLGKPISGQSPFGYRWVDKVLVPDPVEAPVRKLIYELYLEHKRMKTVARILNESGYRTRSGSEFSHMAVQRLITDPTAKGLRRANYTTRSSDKKAWAIKPKEEWIYTKCEPIVSEELWEQCNAILTDLGSKRKPRAKKTVNLFSGLVSCQCGTKMYVPSNSPKYTCSACRNKIPTGDLEEVFHEQLKTFFFSPLEVTNYLSQADRTIKEKEELLASILEEERKTRYDMDKVYKLYLDEAISSEGFRERYKPLEDRLKQILEGVPELQANIDFLKIQYLSSDQIMQEAKDLYSRWPELSNHDKRAIVENITEQIIIGKNEVSIRLCYIPSSHEMMANGERTPAVRDTASAASAFTII